MLAAGAALGVKPPFTLSSLRGKTYGNWIFSPALIISPSIFGLGSGKGAINRNVVGGNWGFVALMCTPKASGAANSNIVLQLNNWKQGSYTMFVKNNGKTYTFTKAKVTNNYAVTGAPADEFYNLIKANVNKQLICVVTPK